jgi:hypothetical protein
LRLAFLVGNARALNVYGVACIKGSCKTSL